MDIHRIYQGIFRTTGFRRRRMQRFAHLFEPGGSTRIIDIGGSVSNWSYLSSDPRVTLVNIDGSHDRSDYPANIRFERADALRLPFEDGSFDIAYSNSLIEHLHTWENQRKFVDECRRVADRFWIQTPAREFFLEPHLLTPFVHWLPQRHRRRLLRNFTVWGWLRRPDDARVDELVREIRLLTRGEMQQLFPDSELWVERWLGLPKSYVVWKA